MPADARSRPRAISIALVGLGRQGRRHLSSAIRLAASEELRIDALVDIDPQCARHAAALNIPFYCDVAELPAHIDACIVATPTPTHRQVAGALLEQGTDVLLEKPAAATLSQTRFLVDLAERRQRILQIGYLQRYHNAFTSRRPDFSSPTRIISKRSTTNRTIRTPAELVLELMIHDLDMLTAWLDREPIDVSWKRIRCESGQVSASLDLRFSGGHRAELQASSGAALAVRQTVTHSASQSLEFSWGCSDRSETAPTAGMPYPTANGGDDPLSQQLRAFVEAVRARTPPLIDGRAAIKTMRLAQTVMLTLPVTA